MRMRARAARRAEPGQPGCGPGLRTASGSVWLAFVDGGANGRDRQPGADGGLTSGRLTQACAEHAAHAHFVHSLLDGAGAGGCE